MASIYTIGELAATADLPASTIRHYEREGLLLPAGRTESNYRVYGPAALERLRFIRAAQVGGFSLEDVKHLLTLRTGTVGPCPEVQRLLEARLAEAEQRIAGLRRVRSALRASLVACKKAGRGGRCQVLEELSHRALRGGDVPRNPRKGRRKSRP